MRAQSFRRARNLATPSNWPASTGKVKEIAAGASARLKPLASKARRYSTAEAMTTANSCASEPPASLTGRASQEMKGPLKPLLESSLMTPENFWLVSDQPIER